MKFDNLHHDTTCECLENSKQNTDNVFVRKIRRPEFVDKDFQSPWDLGRRRNPNDCKIVCGEKGISINIWNSYSQQEVLEKFLETFRISPKSKDGICIFKFKEDAGLLKYTPNNKDAFHYDFYKSDEFVLEMIECIEVKELRSFLEKNEDDLSDSSQI